MRWFLLLVMFVGNIVAIPFVNTVHPIVIGMPFFLFWILLWMVLTPFLTWWIYAMDRNRESENL